MKKLPLFLMSFSALIISGCCENWTPAEFWNIEISPGRVKRGDEITITYSTIPGLKENIEALFIDKDGNLLLSEEFKGTRPDDEGWNFDDNYNYFVRFNTKIPDSAEKYTRNKAEDCTSVAYECGGEKITYHYSKYDLAEVYPAKYVSFEFGKIVCKVPDNAVSGVIFLDYPLAEDASGFSGEKLIIVDDDGNEINK